MAMPLSPSSSTAAVVVSSHFEIPTTMATSTKDKEYFKAWYTRNKEKVIARVKEYNATHREAQNARMQQWREKNREKIAAYREIHREQRRQYKRDHYRRTKEKRKQAAAAAASPTSSDDDPTSSRMSLSFLMHPAPPAYVEPLPHHQTYSLFFV